MQMRRWSWVLLAALPALGAAERVAPAPSRHAESEARLRRDITFLASDACEGRGPGTAGLDKAAEHVAAAFKKAGLKPGGPDGSYFQPFTLNANVLDAPAHLVLRGPLGQTAELRQGVQFWPMGLGAAGADRAGVVFAGYGITSDKARYDDYAGLDAAHKVVVVLRGAPPTAGRDRARELNKGASFTAKIANARSHEAAALLVVNDADTARDGDELLDFSFTAFGRSSATIPVCHVRRDVLERMLTGGADELNELEQDINRELKPHSRPLPGWVADVEVRMHRGKVAVKNVVGVLDGAGPLADETVVVGAHYDHLGYGGFGSLGGLKKKAIHHGADDNASGTTTLLELARRFTQRGADAPRSPRRRLVFIAFSGEELGLYGSEYYCKNPLFPLKTTAAMYNLDMVGRLRPDKDSGKPRLLTEGTGTAKPFRPLMDELADRHGFKMVHKPGGFGPSDHASFCGKDVPVLFVWTDYHPDYHRPSDTADKINVEGMRRIADLSQDVITALAKMDKPEFVKVKTASNRPSGGPRLGIVPGDGGGKGVLVEELSPGEPAERAGLKTEDLIVSLAGKPVRNLQDLLAVLKAQKAGDTLEVGIVRREKPMTVKVKLENAAAGMHADMPRLGIRPSYSDEGEGVLVEGVRDDDPAARAGIRAEDRIVRIADRPVKNLDAYMEALGAQKKGTTIDVVIVRKGKRMTVKVKLD